MRFPPEFSMAVYVPLFLPTAMPLLVGAMWDTRHLLNAGGARQRGGEARETRQSGGESQGGVEGDARYDVVSLF